MHPVNQFFPLVLVLNQASRPDRLAQFKAEADRHGITYQVFPSIPHPRSFTSFNLSFYAMLCHLVASNYSHMLVLEDDVIFDPGLDYQFSKAVEELPEAWDLFYLGANVLPGGAGPYSKRLNRLTSAWTTHAVGIHRNVAQGILEANYDVHNGMMDDYFSKRIQPRGGSYICKPMLAEQRPGFSNLWNRQTDYREIFKNAKSRLV